MFGLGVPELVLILIIGLVIFGPGKLPDVGKIAEIREPIITAWSTPAAAFLVVALSATPYAEAVGAYIVSAVAFVLLGLSGGIDSALTLAIACDALGADKVRAVRHPGDDVSGGGRVDYSSFRDSEDIGLGPGRPEFDGVAADVLSCTEPHGLRVPFPETPDVERERVGVGQVEGVELDEELDAALAFVIAADQRDVPRAAVRSQGRRLAVDGTDRGHDVSFGDGRHAVQ